ncbi:hypothetical protein CABS01_03134 [Colletotrichum abscissum]|uniref:Uncharacterized protein n=1 Tax=Colletotrichum lupini TaxID=145971 RepID=A0A9Q8STQ8_9PEZI|nr:uncharacterized protein CLUP02_08533 [Colletotrichum lupini]XP_060392430.1 uncharacterized protein CABS01_03134 [Colletotrichum abscissum]KAK1477832.1 hypothetical protein CABS01_03134 [Colletotrichum abscissum]UQC83043.1 hypothetical protein CLUP02_08533 [Colletotrichum lupini]
MDQECDGKGAKAKGTGVTSEDDGGSPTSNTIGAGSSPGSTRYWWFVATELNLVALANRLLAFSQQRLQPPYAWLFWFLNARGEFVDSSQPPSGFVEYSVM